MSKALKGSPSMFMIAAFGCFYVVFAHFLTLISSGICAKNRQQDNLTKRQQDYRPRDHGPQDLPPTTPICAEVRNSSACGPVVLWSRGPLSRRPSSEFLRNQLRA